MGRMLGVLMVDKNRINWARRGGACAFTEQLFQKGVIGAEAVLSLLLETQTTALSLSSLQKRESVKVKVKESFY